MINILKVYCSYLFDCARLEMGNFTFSQGAPARSVEIKEYKVVKYVYSWLGDNSLAIMQQRISSDPF